MTGRRSGLWQGLTSCNGRLPRVDKGLLLPADALARLERAIGTARSNNERELRNVIVFFEKARSSVFFAEVADEEITVEKKGEKLSCFIVSDIVLVSWRTAGRVIWQRDTQDTGRGLKKSVSDAAKREPNIFRLEVHRGTVCILGFEHKGTKFTMGRLIETGISDVEFGGICGIAGFFDGATWNNFKSLASDHGLKKVLRTADGADTADWQSASVRRWGRWAVKMCMAQTFVLACGRTHVLRAVFERGWEGLAGLAEGFSLTLTQRPATARMYAEQLGKGKSELCCRMASI
jgi:hypothetical protein